MIPKDEPTFPDYQKRVRDIVEDEELTKDQKIDRIREIIAEIKAKDTGKNFLP